MWYLIELIPDFCRLSYFYKIGPDFMPQNVVSNQCSCMALENSVSFLLLLLVLISNLYNRGSYGSPQETINDVLLVG